MFVINTYLGFTTLLFESFWFFLETDWLNAPSNLEAYNNLYLLCWYFYIAQHFYRSSIIGFF